MMKFEHLEGCQGGCVPECPVFREKLERRQRVGVFRYVVVYESTDSKSGYRRAVLDAYNAADALVQVRLYGGCTGIVLTVEPAPTEDMGDAPV